MNNYASVETEGEDCINTIKLSTGSVPQLLSHKETAAAPLLQLNRFKRHGLPNQFSKGLCLHMEGSCTP